MNGLHRMNTIMECQSDAITERAAQRAQARQQMTVAERKRAQKQLEDQTKASDLLPIYVPPGRRVCG